MKNITFKKTYLIFLLLLCLFSGIHNRVLQAEEKEIKAHYLYGFDPKHMDKTIDPCDNFYQYACGGFIKNNTIPKDRSSWTRFNEIHERVSLDLQKILSDIKNTPSRKEEEQQLSDFYQSCMDEALIEKQKLAPIQPMLAAVDKLSSIQELPILLATLHQSLIFPFFKIGVSQDFKDNTRMMFSIDQGGLGLPEKAYYLNAEHQKIKQQYQAHIARMLTQLQESQPEAAAAAVLKIETALARASLDVVQRRDPHTLYHPTDITTLKKYIPSFNMSTYLQEIGVMPIEQVNIVSDVFIKAVQDMLKKTNLKIIKQYLRWHIINASASSLNKEIRDEHFAFYGHTLKGIQAPLSRIKKCVEVMDESMGEALSHLFVERHFSEQNKKDVAHMVELIIQAMKKRIETLDFMSQETKQQALIKLKKIVHQIGYPEHWRSYHGLQIDKNNFFNNVQQASIFEFKRRMTQLKQPVDRNEWHMTPATVNAYYSPETNQMVFPAGFLQPPFYDPKMDLAVNYGDIGSSIGHELIHAFDDEGSRFDEEGRLRSWWTKKDDEQFKQRVQCVIDHYSNYTVIDQIKLNGALTAGEDVADIAGTILAYEAFKQATNENKDTPRNQDGLTPEQRFFLGNAQQWCSLRSPEDVRLRAATDPHSPPEYRTNGVMVHMPEFAQAFSCKSNSRMTTKQVCRVW